MSKGRVYVVTNPEFPHLFKIGYTTKGSVEERGLNGSNVPENFVTIKEYECDDPKRIEDILHDTYDDYRHWTCGKVRQTEFFYIVCLESVLRWMDTLKGLTDVTDKVRAEEEMVEEKIRDQNDSETEFIIGRRPNTTFAMVNIPPGSTLSLDIDENAIVRTVDKKNLVELNGEKMSISAAVNQLMQERGKKEKSGFSGPLRFMYEGENIFQRRLRMEKEGFI